MFWWNLPYGSHIWMGEKWCIRLLYRSFSPSLKASKDIYSLFLNLLFWSYLLFNYRIFLKIPLSSKTQNQISKNKIRKILIFLLRLWLLWAPRNKGLWNRGGRRWFRDGRSSSSLSLVSSCRSFSRWLAVIPVNLTKTEAYETTKTSAKLIFTE